MIVVGATMRLLTLRGWSQGPRICVIMIVRHTKVLLLTLRGSRSLRPMTWTPTWPMLRPRCAGSMRLARWQIALMIAGVFAL